MKQAFLPSLARPVTLGPWVPRLRRGGRVRGRVVRARDSKNGFSLRDPNTKAPKPKTLKPKTQNLIFTGLRWSLSTLKQMVQHHFDEQATIIEPFT